MDNNKPIAPLIGANGNIFNLLSIARNSLIASNKPNDAHQMWDRVTSSKSYNEALIIISDYVEFGESDGQNVSDQQRQRETSGINVEGLGGSQDDAAIIYGLNISNQSITKVDFTQELHITNSNIDEIMESALEEGTINWYESISSSPTSIKRVETNLISSGGTIFFRIQGENYSRTFDKYDLIYGLLRELPNCFYIINGDQINTDHLDNENIDHIIQYGLFGEIEY